MRPGTTKHFDEAYAIDGHRIYTIDCSGFYPIIVAAGEYDVHHENPQRRSGVIYPNRRPEMGITPTVGRVVLAFYPGRWKGPRRADITSVNESNDTINVLATLDEQKDDTFAGRHVALSEVRIIDPLDEQQRAGMPPGIFWCEWMTYQKGQSAASSAVETRLTYIEEQLRSARERHDQQASYVERRLSVHPDYGGTQLLSAETAGEAAIRERAEAAFSEHHDSVTATGLCAKLLDRIKELEAAQAEMDEGAKALAKELASSVPDIRNLYSRISDVSKRIGLIEGPVRDADRKQTEQIVNLKERLTALEAKFEAGDESTCAAIAGTVGRLRTLEGKTDEGDKAREMADVTIVDLHNRVDRLERLGDDITRTRVGVPEASKPCRGS